MNSLLGISYRELILNLDWKVRRPYLPNQVLMSQTNMNIMTVSFMNSRYPSLPFLVSSYRELVLSFESVFTLGKYSKGVWGLCYLWVLGWKDTIFVQKTQCPKFEMPSFISLWWASWSWYIWRVAQWQCSTKAIINCYTLTIELMGVAASYETSMIILCAINCKNSIAKATHTQRQRSIEKHVYTYGQSISTIAVYNFQLLHQSSTY